MSIILTPKQQEVHDNILKDLKDIINGDSWGSGLIDLQGYAGTGKTTLLSFLIRELKALNLKVKITTPTHKSLKVATDMIKGQRIPSSTIHSHLNLKQKPSNNPQVDYILEQDEQAKLKEKVDVLIVDESSMVSDELYKFIEKNIEQGRTNCVLFCGDSAQLEPVDGKENPIYNNDTIKHYKLTEVVRQAKDNPIIYIATKFREAIENNKRLDIDWAIKEVPLLDTVELYSDLKKWFRAYFGNSDDKSMIAYTNKTVDAYNQFIRTFVHKNNDIPYLINNEIVVLQSSVTDESGKVSLYRNGEEVQVKNPVLIKEEGMEVWTYNGIKTVDVNSMPRYNEIKNKLKNDAIKDKKLWFLYYKFLEEYTEIKHIHACTIHKSQGSSYKNVWFNLQETKMYLTPKNRNTIYRLIYVALTRTENTVHILM